MIQDIAPKKFDNHYVEMEPGAEDWILIYREREVLCRFENGQIRYPKLKEIIDEHMDPDLTYLFSVSGEHFFLLKEGLDIAPDGRPRLFSGRPVPGILLLPGLPENSWMNGIAPIVSAAAAAGP